MCDKGFICNPSNCECECDKSCDRGEYLDYKNYKYRNKLVDKLVEECIANIDVNKMIHNETLDVIPLNYYKNVCNSCTIYIVLLAVFFITSICIGNFFYVFSLVFKEKIMFVLSLIMVFEQQLIEYISIGSNAIECL